MTNAVNPYAAPAARLEDVSLNPEAEAIRRAHINHEASIKAVGLLYYLGGAGVTLSAVGTLVVAGEPQGMAIAVGLLVLGVGTVFAGWGVRALRAWARILGSVLSAIGLLGFPVGTLINGYILYLFLSKKGGTVFSPAYRDVIAATPEIKYRTSVVIWILLALVVGLIVVAFLAPMLGR